MSTCKKFFVEVQGLTDSVELPVWADSLEEAQEIAEAEYEDMGFTVNRIRPEVKHNA
ncbi:MAG: inhibitor of host bacterial RNA polymerase [Spirochaetia bacterium]|nr:inhibitor of host bacterial RNA polymerase [Spirochaetia bacterium]